MIEYTRWLYLFLGLAILSGCQTQQTAPGMQVSVFASVGSAAPGADGLVNCTPVGMVGYEGTPLPPQLMGGASWAFDAVYTPRDTEFLGDAARAGLDVISGYELFFHQGVHAWKRFDGRDLDEERLRRELETVETGQKTKPHF